MTLARILLRSTLRSRTSHYTAITRPLLVRCSSSQFHSSAFLEKASVVEWGHGSKEMNIFESDSVIPQVPMTFSSHSPDNKSDVSGVYRNRIHDIELILTLRTSYVGIEQDTNCSRRLTQVDRPLWRKRIGSAGRRHEPQWTTRQWNPRRYLNLQRHRHLRDGCPRCCLWT